MRKFLLIPGTGGSNFSDELGKKASYVFEIFLGHHLKWSPALVKELSCGHPVSAATPWNPSRLTLLGEGKSIVPREVLWGTAYTSVDQSKYSPFPYDWRLDIRYNALLLIDYLKKGNQSNPGTKWSILTHSQGGLLVCAASLMAGAQLWNSFVERVCLVAPPVMGTINSMDAMVRGNNFGNINNDFFKAASKTWPALFQMFPQWNCVEIESAKRSTSESIWPKESQGFISLLNRAKDYMAWLNYDPFKNLDAAKLMIVLGNNPKQNTLVSIVPSAEGPVISHQMATGDTLVPFAETMNFIVYRGLRNRVLEITGPYQENHFRMLSDAVVYNQCDTFLSLS